ncbi:MAG TPA: serine hydrolase [Rhizomicrobium sp.]|jgi:CubicO group peptidase (beta-lactamase class C family)
MPTGGTARRAHAAFMCATISIALFACAPTVVQTTPPVVAQAPAPRVIWPTHGWPTSTPEAQGIDSGRLAVALEQIRAKNIPIHSLLIERHGTIVLDSYFYPFTDNEAHNAYSVTKSVTASLVGIAVREHRLADLNAPVLSLLPDRTSDDPRKSHITLAQLLSMTSGLDCRAQGGRNLLQQMLASPDWTGFMLKRDVVAAPGSTFGYCAGNAELVSAVLTESTGSCARDFARRELFAPLGIADAGWPTSANGVSHGWGDLELQPRDMAKLGYLWLHNGSWDGHEIIPADYLHEALAAHASVGQGVQYGYGMWLYPNHAPADFEANGAGGQRITVIPSLDMVEVMTGDGLDANQVAALIAGAPIADAPLPANSEMQSRLALDVAQAATGPATKLAARVP